MHQPQTGLSCPVVLQKECAGSCNNRLNKAGIHSGAIQVRTARRAGAAARWRQMAAPHAASTRRQRAPAAAGSGGVPKTAGGERLVQGFRAKFTGT